jgi:D-tyrosyl-tRNA(Tyr) deacylase
MRAVVQRVLEAQVKVGPETIGRIDKGLLVYLGVTEGDSVEDAQYIADKLVGLRCFEDEAGKMNRSVQDAGGQVLLVSQFTLCGDCRKGRRPGFDQAATPGLAQSLYEQVKDQIASRGVPVETGRFREHMHVSSINDGPVTLLLDSRRLF